MRPAGKTTIANDVLLSTARLTTLDVEGVSRMGSPSGSVKRLMRGGEMEEGVRLEMVDDKVNLDIFVVLFNDVNVRQVSRNIQESVARAVSKSVGVEIGRINIHIADIDYGPKD